MNPSNSSPTAATAAGRIPRLLRLVPWLCVAGALGCAAWLWFICLRNPAIPFLSASGPAAWIVFPTPPDANPHPQAALPCVFRHSFTLPAAPSQAQLSVRAFKAGAVHLNGQPVAGLVLAPANWKNEQTCDVTRLLKQTTNEISVTVSNSLGPPALWFLLTTDQGVIASDAGWEASWAGSDWKPAARASTPPPIRQGNPLFDRESTRDSLRRAWPALVAILAVAAGLVVAISRFYCNPPATRSGWRQKLGDRPVALLVLICLAWAALFLNNVPQIASIVGFDRDGHLQYVDHIRQKHALPLADEGWQLYQPPLYYIAAALVSAPFGDSASADSAVVALRFFSALLGLAHVIMVFLCLRLLFPAQPARQCVGLLVAGFLPAHLYIAHNVTNELLAALFTTAAFYFCLRHIRSDGDSWRPAVGAGICLGLAMLSKFSALLVIPCVLVAMAWPRAKVAGDRLILSKAARTAALVLVPMLLVCGWHYFRVWKHFGHPIVGNWDPVLPLQWWQEPGFRTSAWYGRFGDAFTQPIFSSIFSFMDGLYSSLWGDGLCSGSARMGFRPAWNFDLMNLGYWVALPVALLMLAGGVRLLLRFLRQPAAESFLLLSVAFAFAFGLAYMTLQVPSYAQVKAFYALPALLPLCALAVFGWDWLATANQRLSRILTVAFASWALATCASFWIRSGNPFVYSAQAAGLADDRRYDDAIAMFDRALQLDPQNLNAGTERADALARAGRFDEAIQQAQTVLQQHPDRVEAHVELGVVLALNKQNLEAIPHLRQALTAGPDHPTTCQALATCLSRLQRFPEVIDVCREGLRVNPLNQHLQLAWASAAGAMGDFTNTATHARFALQLKPGWPDAALLLAGALVALGDVDQAIVQYRAVLESRPDDPNVNYLLGAALATAGNTAAAIEHYRKSLLAQPDKIEALNNLAWLLATDPRPEIRNGAEAVRLGERACELTSQRAPVLLGTLAAAYAEAGRFADSVRTAEKARDLATAAGQKTVADRNTQLLELYRAGKPWHEPPPSNKTPVPSTR